MNYVVVVALAAILTACAPNNVKELREDHYGRHIFTVDQNYRAVYQTVLTKARECYQGGMIAAKLLVDGDLYHYTRRGDVSVALHGDLGIEVFVSVAITAIDDSRSQVVVFTGLQTWDSTAESIRRWVVEAENECHPR